MDIGSEVLIIFLLILINGVFALSEAAVISSRRARLQQQANEGDQRARRALDLAERPSDFLSTVQIGITLIGVLAGAVGGVTIAGALAPVIARVPILVPYADTLALALVVLLITFFSMLLGELVPKRLALRNPERIARGVAGPMMVFARVFRPIVWLLSKTSDAVLWALRSKPSEDPPITEEEIQVLLDQGMQAGVIEETEQDMVAGVFRMHERRVSSLMTPRSEVVWLDVNDTPEEIERAIEQSEFSIFPVCQDSLDEVLGTIKARDLLIESLRGEPLALKRNLQPVSYIPETSFASRALDIFKAGSAEMLIIVDEFGSLQGILTISDILEEIVGDIETGGPQATQRQDGSWLLDGMLDVDDFKEIFNIRHLPDEDEFETLGGFMMIRLGRVPKAADRFDWNALTFEVMDMDGNRVDKVLVTTKPPQVVKEEEKE
jgi:magnesium and cobalt exporter, CNNM family